MSSTMRVQAFFLATFLGACGSGSPVAPTDSSSGGLAIGLSSGTASSSGGSEVAGSSSGGSTGSLSTASASSGTSGGSTGGFPPSGSSTGNDTGSASSTGGSMASASSTGGGTTTGGGTSTGNSGTTGGPPLPTVCTIGGQTYQVAESNPQNSCELCIPEVNATAWSSVGDGASCAGGFCEQGQCTPGCVVDGGFFASGAGDPANVCEACAPTASNASFTPVGGNPACSANGGDFCVQGSCTAACLVSGQIYLANAGNPANECQSCDPSASSTAFSNAADGTACHADGGDFCKGGACGSYCDVGGTLADPGSANPANANECCNPAVSSQGWSPEFGASLNTPHSSYASDALCVGDVTGDGLPDIVVPLYQSVLIYRGLGDGGFQAGATTLTLPSGAYAEGCALADFNDDGLTDIAVVGTWSAEVTVLLNRGGNAFAASTVTGPVGTAIAVVDLQATGSKDLVVGGRVGSMTGIVSTLLNKSHSGSFIQGDSYLLPTQANPTAFAVAPFFPGSPGVQFAVFDTSGTLTILSAQSGGSRLALLSSAGLGALANLSATGPGSLAVADFNQDGLPDLAVAVVGHWLPLFDRGTSFSAGGVVYPTGSNTYASIAAGDFNGDGLPDVALAVDASDQLLVALNGTAKGSSTPVFGSTSYPVGVQPAAVAASDLNRDGRTDLVTSNWTSANFSALLGQCP